MARQNVARRATFSKDRKYRTWLDRIWDLDKPMINFIMLNPSIADADIDDPTVSRCMERAERWEFGGVIVTNIFALVSTDPKALYTAIDPIGNHFPNRHSSMNNRALLEGWMRSTVQVCAWGTHGQLLNRGAEVKDIMKKLGLVPTALKVSDKTGQPHHPLYLPYNLEPQPWV